MFYLTTLGANYKPFCISTVPNLSLLSHLHTFPLFSTSAPHLHISSNTSQLKAMSCSKQYQNFPMAASSQMMPKNLQSLPSCTGVHLGTVSNHFTPGDSYKLFPPLTLPLYFLLHLECTVVGLHHPVVKLLHGVFHLLQAD